MIINVPNIRRTAPLFAAIVFLLAACSHGPASRAVPPAFIRDGQLLRVPADSPLRQRLVVQPVELRRLPHLLTLPATVEADPARTANVLSPLTGKLEELHVDLGDHVSRGQLLAVIASGDLAQAYADVAKARDALELARKTLDRVRGVARAGGAAVKDLQAAQSAQVQAQAEFDRAQTRLIAVGGTPGGQPGVRRLRITAPIGGSVTALNVAPGTYINDPNAPLLTIANLDTVWISADVPEDQIGLVAKGQPVDVSLPAWPGRTFHGRVDFVSAVLDPNTRTAKARIAIANPDGRLKPNMYASATFAVPRPALPFVPESALLMNNDSITVLVEVQPWTFVRRTVELGLEEPAGARVLKGLEAGDRVVVRGGGLLND